MRDGRRTSGGNQTLRGRGKILQQAQGIAEWYILYGDDCGTKRVNLSSDRSKVLDIISRLLETIGEASDAATECTQVKMEDA